MNHIISTYENSSEEIRLFKRKSRQIEFITSIRVMKEHFPKSGKILDCAAGAGAYAFYFDQLQYNVTALDITPRHVELMKKYKELNDAVDLSCYADECFDIVLCMGPLYHLTAKESRIKCLKECCRVLKPKGLLVTSYKNKYSVFPYLAVRNRYFLNKEFALKILQTGTIESNDRFCFWTDMYYSFPHEMEELYRGLHLKIKDHISPDGVTPFLREVDDFTDEEFNEWCNYHYLVCREKSILGAGKHGIRVGRN